MKNTKFPSFLSSTKQIATLFVMLLFLGTTWVTAQTRNPKPSSYNPYATYTNGEREYLRLGTGQRNEILRDTPLYDGRGLQIATAKAGLLGDINGSTRGGYNAGAIIKIKVNGIEKNAVLCWNVYIIGGRKTGFIITDDLKYKSIIESRMNECKVNLANVRPNDYNKSTTYYLIKNKTVPSIWDNAYVYPNQTGAQNKVRYYYVNDGILNLLVDLPYTKNVGGEIKGKAIDLASPGRSFRRITSIPSEKRDVFKGGTRTVIGEVSFVYGFVYTDTNERVYCWANLDCLEKPSSSKQAIAKLSQEQEDENLTVDYKLYPNPAINAEINIITKNPIKNVEMFDINGRKLNIMPEHISDNKIKIYSNYIGMAFIHLQDMNDKKIIYKVIFK